MICIFYVCTSWSLSITHYNHQHWMGVKLMNVQIKVILQTGCVRKILFLQVAKDFISTSSYTFELKSRNLFIEFMIWMGNTIVETMCSLWSASRVRGSPTVGANQARAKILPDPNFVATAHHCIAWLFSDCLHNFSTDFIQPNIKARHCLERKIPVIYYGFIYSIRL